MQTSIPFTARTVWIPAVLTLAQPGSTGCRDFTDDAHIPASGGQTEAGKRFQPDQHLMGTNLQVSALDFLGRRGCHGSEIV